LEDLITIAFNETGDVNTDSPNLIIPVNNHDQKEEVLAAGPSSVEAEVEDQKEHSSKEEDNPSG